MHTSWILMTHIEIFDFDSNLYPPYTIKHKKIAFFWTFCVFYQTIITHSANCTTSYYCSTEQTQHVWPYVGRYYHHERCFGYKQIWIIQVHGMQLRWEKLQCACFAVSSQPTITFEITNTLCSWSHIKLSERKNWSE